MGKKDRGAFQRKRAQKIAKQKAKKAKAQRSARHDVPLAYTGARYQSERYVMPLMVAEIGVLNADQDSGGKLLDSDVRAAYGLMVRQLHTGPQDIRLALNELRETDISDARQRQIVLSITASWDDFFESGRPLPRADLVGILRMLVHSLDTRGEMHPGGRGYLQYLREFVPEAIAALERDPHFAILDEEDDGESWEEDELIDDMYDELDIDASDDDDAIDVVHRPAGSDEMD
jgi:hypothetical protein